MQGPENTEPHETTLAVWDLASPLVVGRRSTIKVGAKCSRGCDLTGADIELRSDTGFKVGSAKLGATPWPGTSALYWTEVDLTVPATEGPYSWTVAVQAAERESPHQQASSTFRFVVVKPPEHSVTLKITRKDTEAAVEDVEVRLGVFRAATDEAGSATVEVPRGTYDLTAWKAGYEVASRTVEVTGDVDIELQIVPAPDQDEQYWM